MTSLDQHLTRTTEVLHSTRFSDLPRFCGQDSMPGVDEVPEWREWAHRPPTADQRRIERFLKGFLRPEDSLLHIGVGGSQLAQRFTPRVRSIVGMTISDEEEQHGNSLSLTNYQVLLWNKYRYWPDGAGRFDAIVDNNPTTFACCLRHVVEMVAWYAEALTSTGAFFTDRVGLGWVVTGGDRRWSFDRTALADLVAPFGLAVVDLDGDVYGIARPSGMDRLAALRRRSRLRSTVRGLVRHFRARHRTFPPRANGAG